MSGYEGIPMGDLTDSPPPSPGATAETTTTTTPNTSTSTASATTTTSSKKRGREPDTSLFSQSSTSTSSSAPSPASQSYFPPPPPPPSFAPPPPPPSLPPTSPPHTKASANNNDNKNDDGNENEGISFKEACGLLTTHFENRNSHLSEFFRAAGGTPCGDWEGAIELLWYERGVMRWQPEPEGWPLWSHNHLHYCTYTDMEGIAVGSVAVWEGEEEGEIW